MSQETSLPQHKDHGSAHVESLSHTADEKAQKWGDIGQEAQQATEDEHQMTLGQALKKYRKACFWSAVFSLCIIMDGYDQALIPSFMAFPAFQHRYGHEVGSTGKYQVRAPWQVACGLASTIGNVFGIFINAVLTEKFGHKKVLLGTLVVLTGIIFIPFFAPSIEIIFAGQILSGVPWGIFTTMAPAYASELCPVILRSYLETFVVLCWGIGQFLSWSVLLTLNTNTTRWAYRIPFAVQWVWPVIIFPLALFAPESPWWLVRKNRVEDAERSLKRLTSNLSEQSSKKAIALMIETNNLEKDLTRGTSFLDCFKGSNLWRTEISCMAWASQTFCSFVITGNATYFYEQAGLASSSAYKMTVGQGGLHFICTLVSVWFTGRYGRRNLWLWGLALQTIPMLIIGFISIPKESVSIAYAQAAMFLLWYGIYELTTGPVAYIIVGETSSTRLRSKTIGLARNAYNLANIVNGVVGPYILNPTEGNWKGKCGFLTGGLIILCAVWAYFRLPECRGRTYEELDIMFADRSLSAKDFKKQEVNVRQELVMS